MGGARGARRDGAACSLAVRIWHFEKSRRAKTIVGVLRRAPMISATGWNRGDLIATPARDLRLRVLVDDELLRGRIRGARPGLFDFKVDAIGSVAELGSHLEHSPDMPSPSSRTVICACSAAAMDIASAPPRGIVSRAGGEVKQGRLETARRPCRSAARGPSANAPTSPSASR
jgi:hypothetical protein